MREMTAEQKKLLLKWVGALRSGKYPQTRFALKDDKGHCCLGVLCDVVDPAGWVKPGPPEKCVYHRGQWDSPSIQIWMSLPESVRGERDTLQDMNDKEDKSFAEIADYIESLYET